METKGIEVDLDRDIQLYGGELFGESCLIGKFAEFFLLFAFQLIGVFKDAFHAVKLFEELLGGLGADPGDAGNVINTVSAEAEHIDDLINSDDAPLFEDGGDVEDLDFIALAPGAVHVDALGHELPEVFVRGDHVDGLKVFFFGAVGEGADDVVSFVAVEFEDGDAEGLGDAVEVGHGGGEVLRHFLAVGLVLGVDDMPLGRCGGIKDDGEVAGLPLIDDVDEGGGKPEDGGGIETSGGMDGAVDQGEVGAVGEGHAIEQVQCIHKLGSVGGFGSVCEGTKKPFHKGRAKWEYPQWMGWP